MMSRLSSASASTALLSLLLSSTAAQASGVSPYLPMGLSPSMERNIEQVMILAGEPVIRRPIPAAVVLDALPKACALDRVLCQRVQGFLQRYTRYAGVTQLSAEAALHDGDSITTIPNSHGRQSDSSWQVAASAFYLPNDHLLLNIGGIAYDDRAVATGSYLTTGFDFAQIDAGYRDHWLSPLTDSSLLISDEATTMPSITISNHRPLTRLGFSYEVFVAEMSPQTNIQNNGSYTSGHPTIAGLQAAILPGAGYALAFNRLVQYGGGERSGGGVSGFVDALFNPSINEHVNTSTEEEFGNQQASITSTMAFPGKLPFAVRFEYAGEDHSYADNYRLGATAFSLGIDLPLLGPRGDLSYETSEWQGAWYVHHLYPLGMTHEGQVLGHWSGDQRQFGDAPWGRSQMLRAGWRTLRGNYWQLRYRTLSYEPLSSVDYEPLHQLELQYATQWRRHDLQLAASGGKDAFGDSFARASVFFDLATSDVARMSDVAASARDPDSSIEVFIDAGANYSELQLVPGVDQPDVSSPREAALHVAVGARRRLGDHVDLGVRLEYDQVAEDTLWSARLIDYRYRFNRRLALSLFGGAGRYADGLPAYGYFGGVGVQYLGIARNWDLGLDYRQHNKLGREKLLPEDPPSTPDRTRLFYDVNSFTLYLSRRL